MFEQLTDDRDFLRTILSAGTDLITQSITARNAPIPDFGPIPAQAGMVPTGFPAAIGATGARSLLNMLGGGAVVAAGRGLVSAAGKLISRKKAVQLAKVLGVQGAATALGIGAVELAEAVIADDARKRRGGGVTAAQLRTTRKTMRKVMGMAKTIRGACSETGFLARRSAPRVVACAPKRR